MTYTYTEDNEEVKITAYKTDKTESNLKPLCRS